jgi:hypothetical protein
LVWSSLTAGRPVHGHDRDEGVLRQVDQMPTSVALGFGIGVPVEGFALYVVRAEVDRLFWRRLELSLAFRVTLAGVDHFGATQRFDPLVGAALLLHPASWLRLALGWRIGPSFERTVVHVLERPAAENEPLVQRPTHTRLILSLCTVAFAELRLVLGRRVEVRLTPIEAVWRWHDVWLPGAGHRLDVAVRF